MTRTRLDGIDTEYEVTGSGPPLLLFSPGGFDARMGNWRRLGIYGRIKVLEELQRHFTCIAFDRRESGGSGGRVERIRWSDYARQGRLLLEHLQIGRAHVMGGCAGCSVALAFAVEHTSAVDRMVLFWPAGGARYRLAQQARFAQHLAMVQQHGLAEVVHLARTGDGSFSEDPRPGPWVSALRSDPALAEAFVKQDPERYLALVAAMARTLFDRDTVSGADPEDLLQLDLPTLVIPGADRSHATSAARYCAELLASATYWDQAVQDQTAALVLPRIVAFLGGSPIEPAPAV